MDTSLTLSHSLIFSHTNAQDEVLLEFHVDDTAADDREDTLVEMAFHVPAGNARWAEAGQQAEGEGEEPAAPVPAAKVCVAAGWLGACVGT